jgi:hypothetical protein
MDSRPPRLATAVPIIAIGLRPLFRHVALERGFSVGSSMNNRSQNSVAACGAMGTTMGNESQTSAWLSGVIRWLGMTAVVSTEQIPDHGRGMLQAPVIRPIVSL